MRVTPEELERCLQKLQSWVEDYKENKKLLKMVKEDRDMDFIIAVITLKTGVTDDEIKGKGRKSRIVTPRQIFCKVAYMNGYSLKEIGRYINRDHTTILYSIKSYENYYQTEPEYKELADQIIEKCRI